MALKTKVAKYFKTQKDLDEFRKQVTAAKPVLDILRKVIQEELDASILSMRKEENYEKPAWSELMADKLGEQRALSKIYNLIP